MANSIEEIKAQMISIGIEPVELLIPDGKTHRFCSKNSQSKEKKAWYRIYSNKTKSGQVYFSGAFGEGGQKYTIQKGVAALLSNGAINPRPEDIKPVEDPVAEAENKAAVEATALWAKASDDVKNHPYVVTKKIHAYGARQLDRTLLIPVYFEKKLVGLQRVFEKNNAFHKRFLTGQKVKGCYNLLGNLTTASPAVFVCEGFATGCSIYEASGIPTLVTFSSQNLEAVVKNVRKKMPNTRIYIGADNDRLGRAKAKTYLKRHFDIDATVDEQPTEHKFTKADGSTVCWKLWSEGQGELEVVKADVLVEGKQSQQPVFRNGGLETANAVAQQYQCNVVCPKFSSADEGTDFNDLAVQEGEAVVKEQISKALSTCENVTASKREQRPGDLLAELTDRFIYIFPHSRIWDRRTKQFVSFAAINTMFDHDVVKLWKKTMKKVEADKFVFDPSQTCDSDCINAFEGWPLVPKKGDCSKLLRHIYENLCGGSNGVFDWVLKWLAFPLRHPGAKMDTALVIYGAQGAGKSFVFENAVMPIYGQYAYVILPVDLRKDFNEGSSHKLFVLAEEALADKDSDFQKAMMKNMITEKVHTIRQKHMDDRHEPAMANYVFLSNETQPVRLDADDRRYMTIYVKSPFKNREERENYFAEIYKELENGGREAFYYYLLHYDLEDFNEHTAIFETEAHSDLEQLGKGSAERFVEEWLAGSLPIPASAATARDLYAAYRLWGDQSGERCPFSSKRFWEEISKRCDGLIKKKLRLDFIKTETIPGSEKQTSQTTVYIPPAFSKADNSTLEQQCKLFRESKNRLASMIREWGINHS